MQVVIEIPEEAYNLLKGNGVDWLGAEHILSCVAEGKVLPKGHGDLIDRNSLPMRDISPDAWYSPMIGCLEDDLDEVPVIVPRTEVTE